MQILPGDQSQHWRQGQSCQGLDEAAAILEWKDGWSLLCLEQIAVPWPAGDQATSGVQSWPTWVSWDPPQCCVKEEESKSFFSSSFSSPCKSGALNFMICFCLHPLFSKLSYLTLGAFRIVGNTASMCLFRKGLLSFFTDSWFGKNTVFWRGEDRDRENMQETGKFLLLLSSVRTNTLGIFIFAESLPQELTYSGCRLCCHLSVCA